MMTQTALKIDGLPQVRGTYKEDTPLGHTSWFKTGGRAEVLFKPADLEDLQDFLRSYHPPNPPAGGGEDAQRQGGSDVTILGVMSNTIIRDGGIPGVVIRLGRNFTEIETEGDLVHAGALALDATLAQVTAQAGIAGLEFFSGIPGTIGGALRMNAGCYDTETKDVLVECQAVDRQGNLHTLTPDQMGMTYRHTETPEDYIFTRATFRGTQDDPDAIVRRITEIRQQREESQPIRARTGGSTFANPSAEELSRGRLNPDTKVWQLIDKAGGRGLTIGGAQMSEKHCNFMINTGMAKAADLEILGEEIRKRVYEDSGIDLRWEIKRIGNVK